MVSYQIKKSVQQSRTCPRFRQNKFPQTTPKYVIIPEQVSAIPAVLKTSLAALPPALKIYVHFLIQHPKKYAQYLVPENLIFALKI